jgi:chromosome segregation ATPase
MVDSVTASPPDSRAETRPDPDPTNRTLDQLYREIALATEKYDTELRALAEKNAETFRAMDKALILLQQFADKSPTTSNVDGRVDALDRMMDIKIQGSKELSEMRVAYIKEIAEIKNSATEALTNAKFLGNQIALDAALKTQKEASDKIEQNFTKQFENMGTLISTSIASLAQQINDMKERIGGVEGGNRGSTVQKQDEKDSRGFVIAAVSAFVSVIMMLIAVGAIVIAFADKAP